MYGAYIIFIFKNVKYVIHGNVVVDHTGYHRSKLPRRKIFQTLTQRYKEIDLEEAAALLPTLSLRDRLTLDVAKQTTYLKRNYDRSKTYREMSYQSIKNDYNFLPPPGTKSICFTFCSTVAINPFL